MTCCSFFCCCCCFFCYCCCSAAAAAAVCWPHGSAGFDPGILIGDLDRAWLRPAGSSDQQGGSDRRSGPGRSDRAGGSDRFEDVASLEPRPELFEPPFGVLCTLFAMQLCKSVTAFGLADTVEGRTSPGARQPYYSSVSGEGVAVFDLDEVGRGATGHRGRVAGIDRAILRLLAMTQNLTLA